MLFCRSLGFFWCFLQCGKGPSIYDVHKKIKVFDNHLPSCPHDGIGEGLPLWVSTRNTHHSLETAGTVTFSVKNRNSTIYCNLFKTASPTNNLSFTLLICIDGIICFEIRLEFIILCTLNLLIYAIWEISTFYSTRSPNAGSLKLMVPNLVINQIKNRQLFSGEKDRTMSVFSDFLSSLTPPPSCGCHKLMVPNLVTNQIF